MTLEARVFLGHILESIDLVDVLIHHYFSIDIDLAWRTAARDLPELGQRLRTILKELE